MCCALRFGFVGAGKQGAALLPAKAAGFVAVASWLVLQSGAHNAQLHVCKRFA